MKTTGEEIKGRIDALPSDYKACVHIDHLGSGHAEVESFSDADVRYKVSVQKGEGDELEVMCSCPATSLCKHIISYYAVAKGLVPTKKRAPGESFGGREVEEKGLKLITEAVAEFSTKLTDGIALVVIETIRKEIAENAKDKTP